jgi:hypothetical protein
MGRRFTAWVDEEEEEEEDAALASTAGADRKGVKSQVVGEVGIGGEASVAGVDSEGEAIASGVAEIGNY